MCVCVWGVASTSFALGGDGVCFVHDAEGFGFMVGAFVLMHNHHFFSSRFQYQELRICLNVCLQLFPRRCATIKYLYDAT